MGLRYQKRINLGNGLGLNVSKRGVSSSYRTKYGSIGSRGFSFKTGIPGLTFRSSWGKSNEGLIIFAVLGLVYVSAVVIYNVALLLIYMINLIWIKITDHNHEEDNTPK